MGAEFNSRSYDGELTKKQVEKLWNEGVNESLYQQGHSYSGGIGMLGKGISWIEKEFPTEREADDYLVDNHQKWNGAMGVKFIGAIGGKKMYLVGGWCSS
jgi:hypothetical protein